MSELDNLRAAFLTRWGILMVSALFSLPVHADSDLQTFRGLRFGVDVREQIPECRKDCKYTDYAGYCFSMNLPKQTCWQRLSKEYPDPHKVLFFDSLTNSLVLQDALIHQANGKLASVSFFFPTAAFSQLELLFRDKYGKPTSAKEEPWQSKGGVRTKSQIRVWERKDLHIELTAPFDELDKGFATILTQEQRKESLKRETEQYQKLRKDL